jgi:hypothetical protein
LWVVVILIVWAVGLYQAIILTREKTNATDRFSDIPIYEPARTILKEEIEADYLTDYRMRKRTVDRFWRAQYTTVPTVLHIRFNPEQADKSARSALEERRRYCRILEFKDRETLHDTRKRLQQISGEFGADLEETEVSDSVVVFSLSRASDD